MSSSTVRSTILSFLDANSDEDFIDLTARFEEISEMIAGAGLEPSDPWVGVEFIGNDEVPITIRASNQSGKYRETGAIYLHVVAKARLGAGSGLLTRGETLRDLLRGRNISGIRIESVAPLNFGSGATLQFDSGYMSGSFLAAYEFDKEV